MRHFDYNQVYALMGNTCATIALQVFELWTEENKNGFHDSQTKMEIPNGGCGAKHFVGLQKKIEPKHANGFSENCTHFDF
jgi:hypothetical protein